MDHTGIEPAISGLQNRRHPIATSGPYMAAISARHLMFGAGTTKFLMLAPFWFPVWLTVQGISPVQRLSTGATLLKSFVDILIRD